MLKLQVVLEFRLVLGRNAAVPGLFHQLCHALLTASEGRKETTVWGVVPEAIKSMISSYDLVVLITSL